MKSKNQNNATRPKGNVKPPPVLVMNGLTGKKRFERESSK